MFNEIQNLYKLYEISTYNDESLPEYECMVNFFTNNLDYIKNQEYLNEQKQNKMITIESSWGIVTTDDQGNVLNLDVLEIDRNGERCYLLDIVKFDIAEWDKWYEDKFKEPSPKPNDFDVLDLGFWKKDGSYEEADKDYRNNIYN
jgi:hypothetical protein